MPSRQINEFSQKGKKLSEWSDLQVLLLQGAGRASHDGREFPLEVLDHRLDEGLTVLPHLVGQPLVQIEVLPPGKARGIWSLSK